MSSIRKFRSYDEDFDPRDWVDEALEIYIAAHRALADGEHEMLHKFATEKAYPEMMNMAKRLKIAHILSLHMCFLGNLFAGTLSRAWSLPECCMLGMLRFSLKRTCLVS